MARRNENPKPNKRENFSLTFLNEMREIILEWFVKKWNLQTVQRIFFSYLNILCKNDKALIQKTSNLKVSPNFQINLAPF